MDLEAPVLIIDDDPAMTDMVKDILEAAGRRAAVARNAFHGLRLAREVKPAAVLCDLVMPDMSGSDVLRALASDPATARIPRVMMTGHQDADRSCADGFLLKPFHAETMLKLLDTMSTLPRLATKSTGHTELLWRG